MLAARVVAIIRNQSLHPKAFLTFSRWDYLFCFWCRIVRLYLNSIAARFFLPTLQFDYLPSVLPPSLGHLHRRLFFGFLVPCSFFFRCRLSRSISFFPARSVRHLTGTVHCLARGASSGCPSISSVIRWSAVYFVAAVSKIFSLLSSLSEFYMPRIVVFSILSNFCFGFFLEDLRCGVPLKFLQEPFSRWPSLSPLLIAPS